MEAEPLPPPPPRRRQIQGAGEGNVEGSRLSPPFSGYQPRLVGAALRNLGNTCFLNAVLQCITHTVPLVQRIRSADHPSPCYDDNGGFCSFCALQEHVNRCLLMSGSIVAPDSFAENLHKISSYFKLGQQEDAHEFLHCLLDSVSSCYLGPIVKDQPSSLEEDALVKPVFGGRLRSQLRCCDCGHCSDTYEPLLDLSLEIDDVDSLKDALVSFTKVERIEDPETKFTCEGCKAQVSMEKQLMLDQAPEVVALHLKRFKNNGFFTHKIDKFVEYPVELDLKPFLSCPEDEVQYKYDLYAVLVHLGSSYSGHYFCTIRSSPTAWHRIDDSMVARVTETNVLNQEAYILFYIKQGSSCWFSSLMESEEMPHLDIVTDVSPKSVLDNGREHSPSSIENASCSSSRETPQKDEEPGPSNASHAMDDAEGYHVATPPRVCTYRDYDKEVKQAEPGPSNVSHAMDDAERYHVATSPRVRTYRDYDKEVKQAVPTQFPTPRTRLPNIDHHIIDVYFAEPQEDEKENHLPPHAQVESKGSRDLGNSSTDAMRDARMNESVKRLVRGMPSSRRSGILACLSTQHDSLHRRPLLGRSRPLSKEKRKAQWLDGEHSNRKTPTAAKLMPTSRPTLSPRSIKRALFVDDSRMEFDFGSC